MLDLLVWGFWVVFVVYGFWFLLKAKTFQFLTLDDLALTWRLHKHLTGCKASRIHGLIMKKNEVVGFKCDCGYEFTQERLITQVNPQISRIPHTTISTLQKRLITNIERFFIKH